jgi:hypothetical protein
VYRKINSKKLRFLNKNQTYRISFSIVWDSEVYNIEGVLKYNFTSNLWIICHNASIMDGGWEHFLSSNQSPYSKGWALDGFTSYEDFCIFLDRIIY